MATARRVEAVPTPPPVKIVLELSEHEARLIRAILGGLPSTLDFADGSHCPNNSWDIYDALGEAGIKNGSSALRDTVRLDRRD